MTAAQDVEDVLDGSAAGRGDDANPAGQRGNGLLALAIEKPFGGELRLELLECNLQSARALRLEILRVQLQLSPSLVDGDATSREYLQTVLWPKLQQASRAAEHDDGQLGAVVLQSEIKVAGVGGAMIRDLAFNPDVGVLALDVSAYRSDEVVHRPDPPLWNLEVKRELSLVCHPMQFNPERRLFVGRYRAWQGGCRVGYRRKLLMTQSTSVSTTLSTIEVTIGK